MFSIGIFEILFTRMKSTKIAQSFVTTKMAVIVVKISSCCFQLWIRMDNLFRNSKFLPTDILANLRCYAYRQDDPDENYENTDDYVMDCPRFANQGCFKAKFRVGEITNAYNTSYSKGCSMYDLGDIEEVCNEDPDLGELCRCKLDKNFEILMPLKVIKL